MHTYALKSTLALFDPRPDLANRVRLVGQAFALRAAGNMPASIELRIRACRVRGSLVTADNVAFVAGFQPVPLLATYAATQTVVLSLAESLAEELRQGRDGDGSVRRTYGHRHVEQRGARKRRTAQAAAVPGWRGRSGGCFGT